jgi:hypothetical protein
MEWSSRHARHVADCLSRAAHEPIDIVVGVVCSPIRIDLRYPNPYKNAVWGHRKATHFQIRCIQNITCGGGGTNMLNRLESDATLHHWL